MSDPIRPAGVEPAAHMRRTQPSPSAEPEVQAGPKPVDSDSFKPGGNEKLGLLVDKGVISKEQAEELGSSDNFGFLDDIFHHWNNWYNWHNWNNWYNHHH